ncbi:hypothetical protein RB595_001884 [Gaeumannomyces hyphopodioides]
MALQNMPPGLDATYDRILQSLNKNFRAQIISALKWLASSNRELGLDELAEIFILRPGCSIPVNDAERLFKPEAFLKYVSGLVVTGRFYNFRPGVNVRLAHFSVKEYLTSARTAEDPAKQFYSFSEIDAHLHIAYSCLSYHLHRSTMSDDEAKRLCLKDYAARNWARHLEMVPREVWPTEVINAAARALSIQSNSLRLTVKGNDLNPDNRFGNSLHMPQRPQCFTARLGFLQLTNMLLCERPGTCRYLTQEDFDAALPDAAYGGSKAVVQLLLDMGAPVNAENSALGGALRAAADMGHTEIVELLLDCGADINAQHGKKGTALQAAASYDRLEVVQLLVSRGADLNLSTDEAECALACAVSTSGSRKTRILEFLLDCGADINGGGVKGNALQKATGNLPVYQEHFHLLLERGANVNVNMPGGFYGNPLQASFADGQAGEYRAEVETLLDKHANVNAKGGHFGSALQACAKAESDISLIKLLVERDADVNAQGGEYETALQAACANRNAGHEIIPFLLEKGANVNIQGGRHGNALQAACRCQSLETIELLVARGSDVNAAGGEYGSALSAAAIREKNTGILEFLLKKGADINQQGGSALRAVSGFDEIENVRVLLDHGADVNAEDEESGTALQAACYSGSTDTVRLLIGRGANVHARGGHFGSAWHATAARRTRGALELLQLLLDHGFDVNDTGSARYGTALQAALENFNRYSEGCTIIDKLRFLLDHGANANIGAGTYGTPLQSACVMDSTSPASATHRIQSVKFILDNCPYINVDAQGGRFGSALQAAVHSGEPKLVELLLARGADANARGGEYGGALNAAVVRGFWLFVEMLLDHGAKPQLPELDDEWLAGMQKEYGRGVSERLDKFREVHRQV